MTLHTIRMPDLGEGIAEVELVQWHVQPGDLVAEDQILCDVMTDKAAVEIPSSVAGRVVSARGVAGAERTRRAARRRGVAVTDARPMCPGPAPVRVGCGHVHDVFAPASAAVHRCAVRCERPGSEWVRRAGATA